MVLVNDGFGRANGALNGSTTEVGGLVWGAPGTGASGLTISSNKATSTGAGQLSVVDTGSADGSVSATYSGGSWPLLVVRDSAAGRYRLEMNASTFYLEKDTSGTVLASWGLAFVTGDRISLQARTVGGNTLLTVTKNGVIVGTYTDSSGTQRTGTKVGIGGESGATWDDFAFTSGGGVNIVEHQKLETTTFTGTSTLVTFATTPQAGDVVVLFMQWFGGSGETPNNPVIAGLGATWRQYDEKTIYAGSDSNGSGIPSSIMMVARDANASGAVTMAASTTTYRGTVYAYILRSATSASSYISLLRKSRTHSSASTAVTSIALTSHRANAGDLMIGIQSWAPVSGSPTLTMTPAAQAATTLYDGSFSETQAQWRIATGPEDVALSSTRATAAKGNLIAVVATDDIQPEPSPTLIPVRAVEPFTGNTTTTLPCDMMKFSPKDLLVLVYATKWGGSYVDPTVTGLGVTWTKTVMIDGATENRRSIVYVAPAASAIPGDVTATSTNFGLGEMELFVLRGLATTSYEHLASSVTTGTTITGPSVTAETGDLVLGIQSRESISGQWVPSTSLTPSDWVTTDPEGGSYGSLAVAYRTATAAAQAHQVAFTQGASSTQAHISMMRFGFVVPPITYAIARVTENDTANTVRNGDPGSLYEDAPFPGINRDADHQNWFVDGQSVYPTYGTTINGVLEWTWPYAYNTSWQLLTRRIGGVDTSVERYAYFEWYVDAEPGITPRARMRAASGNPNYHVLQEDLGGGWWRSWFDWSGTSGYYSIDDPIGPSFEWDGITQNGKVKVRRFATSRTLGDAYAVFKIQRPPIIQLSGQGLEVARPIGVVTATSRAVDRVIENESAGSVYAPQTAAIGRAVETDSAIPLVIPQFVGIAQVTEDNTAGDLVLPQFISIEGVAETDISKSLSPITPPANDRRANALPIAGVEGSTTDTLENATLETGEVTFPGITKTIWYSYTPGDDDSGLMRFFSSHPDATIRVYDDTDTLVASSLGPFNLKLPTLPYVIQIGLPDDASTEFSMSWIDASPPLYDDFNKALSIDYDYGGESLTLRNATLEPGEPAPGGATASIWANWYAEEEVETDFTFTGYPFDTTYTATIYQGSWASPVASVTGVDTLELSVTLAPDTEYWLQISSPTDQLDIDISWLEGAQEVEPYEPVEYMRAMVYEADGVTLITEVPRRFGANAQEPLNVAGVGSMTVKLDDAIMEAYPDLLRFGHIVKYWLATKCIHAFRIKNRSTTYVSTDEWKGYARTVSGPSVHHLFDDFIVQHNLPLINRRLDTRAFTWAAPAGAWYDPTKWVSTYNTSPQTDPPGDFDKAPKDRARWKNPPKFPDPTAKWMWVSHDSSLNEGNFDPPEGMRGLRYYRKTFELKNGDVFRIYSAADEAYTIYLDGEEVVSGSGEETGYTQLEKRKLKIEAGVHTIAVKQSVGGNGKADGADAFIFSLARVKDNGKPGEVIARSDNSWVTSYERPVPAWNRANVLRRVVQEARERDNESALMMTFGFTNDRDSRGRRWKDRWNQEVGIGTSCLELQGQLSEGNQFDVWVHPDTLEIRAWRRRGRNLSKSITLEAGRNIIAWSVDEVEEVRNDYLVQYDGGWTRWAQQNSVRRFGHREAFITMGRAKGDNDAQRIIRKASRGVAWASKRAGSPEFRGWHEGDPTGSIIAVQGARPFLDFTVGDIIKAPDENGKLRPHRVLSLTVTEDENMQLTYDADLEEI